jgi:hypothetical protein
MHIPHANANSVSSTMLLLNHRAGYHMKSPADKKNINKDRYLKSI